MGLPAPGHNSGALKDRCLGTIHTTAPLTRPGAPPRFHGLPSGARFRIGLNIPRAFLSLSARLGQKWSFPCRGDSDDSPGGVPGGAAGAGRGVGEGHGRRPDGSPHVAGVPREETCRLPLREPIPQPVRVAESGDSHFRRGAWGLTGRRTRGPRVTGLVPEASNPGVSAPSGDVSHAANSYRFARSSRPEAGSSRTLTSIMVQCGFGPAEWGFRTLCACDNSYPLRMPGGPK